MAITNVGGTAGGAANAGAVTLTLPGGLAVNDLIIVAYGNGDNDATNPSLSMTTAGYTNLLGATLHGNNATNGDGSLAIFYKFHNGSDTTAVCAAGGTGTDSASAAALQVFRGVDTSTPFEVTSTTATGTSGGDPNPPSISTFTEATSAVVIAGVVASSAAPLTLTAPTNYTTGAQNATGTDTFSASTGLAYRLSGAADPEDPGVFTDSGTGGGWAAVTMVLKLAPVANTVTHTAPTMSFTGGVHTQKLARESTDPARVPKLWTLNPLPGPPILLEQQFHFPTNYTVTHTGANLVFTGGDSTGVKTGPATATAVDEAGRRVFGASAPFQDEVGSRVFGSTSSGRSEVGAYVSNLPTSGGTNNTVTATAGNFLLTGGVHARTVTRLEAAGSFLLTGGTHTRTVVRTHTGANFLLSGGVHHFSVGRAESAGNLIFNGGTHSRSVGRTHTAGNFLLTGGTHAFTKGFADVIDPAAVPARLALRIGQGPPLLIHQEFQVPINYTSSHAAGNFLLSGGSHSRTVARVHTGANFLLGGGTHTRTVVRSEAAGNFLLTGGTHHFSVTKAETAGNLVFGGGTHTAQKAKLVSHTAASFLLSGGVHHFSLGKSETAGNFLLSGGTHTAQKAKLVSHTAPNLTFTGGLAHVSIGKLQAAANLQFVGGDHIGVKTGQHDNFVAHVAGEFILTSGDHGYTATSGEAVSGGFVRPPSRRTDLMRPPRPPQKVLVIRPVTTRIGHTAGNLVFHGGEHTADYEGDDLLLLLG